MMVPTSSPSFNGNRKFSLTAPMRRIFVSAAYRSILTAQNLKPSSLNFLRRFKSLILSDDPLDLPFTPKNVRPTRHKPKPKPKKKRNEADPKQKPEPLHSDLPFDFRYSYSESNLAQRPIGFREPTRFSPFGPGRLDRKWTGVAAKVRAEPIAEERWTEYRRAVIGEPLTTEEVDQLVERYRHSDCDRQINIGRGGVTHNMLDDIHNHWKRAEAVRIKCLGVPTLDMDNVCFQLEDKTGGKIIYRNINMLLLYRGRNYDTKTRPIIPLMLWRPYAPIYPRLVNNVVEGLTFDETKSIRSRGLNCPALMKLTRNGVYVNVVERVREVFQSSDVVRLDCSYVGNSDCKKIGVKLRDLVPCVPILIRNDQIVLWRGNRCNNSVQVSP